jgi:hypothetical protein
MIKQYKLMIFVNILLGFLFIVLNYVYYYFANRFEGLGALWSPLWLTFYNFKAAATIGDFGAQEPNFSFYFFWALLLINVYFIIVLQRGKETKQTPS